MMTYWHHSSRRRAIAAVKFHSVVRGLLRDGIHLHAGAASRKPEKMQMAIADFILIETLEVRRLIDWVN